MRAFGVLLCLVVEGCAARTSQISGSVRGHDKTPLTIAHVGLSSPASVSAVGTDHRYRLTTDATGLIPLTFSGVGHEPERVLLLVPRKGVQAEVDVTLALPRYSAGPIKPAVIGSFNDFRNDISSIPMSPLPNGRFIAHIPQSKENAYQIVNVTEPDEGINSTHPGPPIAPPGAARYIRREDGRYAAVADTATIEFDPASLERSHSESSVTVRSENRETAEFASFAQTMRRELDAYKRQRLELKQHGASDDEVNAFVRQYDWNRFHGPIRAELRSDRSPLFKQAAMILYLSELGDVAEMSHSQLDHAIVQTALKEVPPSSPLWSAVPEAFPAITWANYHARIDGYADYFDQIVATHPDQKLREDILSYDLSVSYFAGDRERTARVYDRLTKDFPKSKSAAAARKLLAANRKVLPGRPVPRFRVAALGDDSTVYSNESLLGRVYLIDFWGVWCGPCLAEMPQLHKAYEMYKKRGFTILSLSCDPSPEKVEEFRRTRWPMPWLNGFLTNCYKNREQNDLVTSFEVVGFPSSVLIGRDGTVLESGPSLRGERLGETLARVFAAEKASRLKNARRS